MNIVKKMAAQGDVMFRKVESMPNDVVKIPSVDGKHIVAHSETGHHHFLKDDGVEFFRSTDPFVAYLSVADFHEQGDGGASVIHARPYDTHKTINLTPGIWEVRRQREYTPQGFRKVED